MDKKRIEPQVEAFAPANVRTSEIIRIQGHASKNQKGRSGIGNDHTDRIEEEYPPLTDEQMRAIRAAAPIPKPESKLITKQSLCR